MATRPVYRRFRNEGRRPPTGLTHRWVTIDRTMRYQLMEGEERASSISGSRQEANFEVCPVVTSAETVQRIAPRR